MEPRSQRRDDVLNTLVFVVIEIDLASVGSLHLGDRLGHPAAQVDAGQLFGADLVVAAFERTVIIQSVAVARQVPLRKGKPGHAEHATADDVEPQLHRAVINGRFRGLFLVLLLEQLARLIELHALLSIERSDEREFFQLRPSVLGGNELLKRRFVRGDLDGVVVPTPQAEG